VAGARGPTSWEREAIRLLVDDGLDVSILPGPGAPDADSVDAPPERPDAVLVLGGDGGSRCGHIRDALVPRDGVWFWEFGDPPGEDPEAAARRAVAAGARNVAARLLVLGTGEEHPRILYRALLPTVAFSVARTRRRLEADASAWPRRAWRELRGGRAIDSFAIASPLRRSAGPSPAGSAVLRGRARGVARRLFEECLLEEKWSIGVLDRPVQSLLDRPAVSDVRWLDPLPGGDYLADPMGLPGRTAPVLAERFRADAGRGAVVALDIDAPDRSPVVLEREVHLSYPLLVADAGRIVCVPEQAGRGRVAAYPVAGTADARLGAEIVLLPDTPGVDCTLFRHGDLWWLLGSDLRDVQRAKLFGWYAPALEGPWRSHPLNPLKSDAESARSAGPTFAHRGDTYRPAQDCAGAYGGAIVIHRIAELTPERFEEESVVRLVPDPDGPFPDGLHTVTAWGDRTLIDGKRHYRSWRKTARKIRDGLGAPGGGSLT